MKYLNKKFSVFMGGSSEYDKNYDAIFNKKKITKTRRCDRVPYIKNDKRICSECGRKIEENEN